MLQKLIDFFYSKFRREQAYVTHPLLMNDWGRTSDSSISASKCTFLKAGDGSKCYPTVKIINPQGVKEAIILGTNTHVRGELFVFAHDGQITIGDYCYIGEGTRIWSAKSITIGNRVLISHNVSIFDNDTHPIDDPIARHQQFKDIISTGHPKKLDLREEPVVIEDDALIASQCVILKGVTIGKAAVVGAGSVVTKDVPPYTLAAGNPARVIRKLNVPEEQQ